MADYNLVGINGIYLSEDGTDGSLPCRVIVPNLVALRETPRFVDEDLDGGQHVQYGEARGFEILMRIFVLEGGDLTALMDEMNDVEDAGNPHHVTLEGGALGDFDLDCVKVYTRHPDGEFVEDRIENLEILFKVDAVNSVTP